MSARPPGGCCMFSFVIYFYCFYYLTFLIILAFARPGSVSWVSIFPMGSALWRAISLLVGRYRRQIPLCAPLRLICGPCVWSFVVT